MCYSCWREEGMPLIDNPRVRYAAKMAESVYAIHPVGGRLHILLDDWNATDDSLSFCQDELHDYLMLTGERDVEQQCLDAFKALTYEERISALALQEGYWD